MEAGWNLLSSPPFSHPKPHSIRTNPPPPSVTNYSVPIPGSRLPSPQTAETQTAYFSSFIMKDTKEVVHVKECSDVLALAKKALLASEQAVSESNSIGHDSYGYIPRLELKSLSLLDKEIKVRSKRLGERRSKKHGVPKLKVILKHETCSLRRRRNRHHKINEVIHRNDPLFQLFLSGPETKLLTAEGEAELFIPIQELTRLEEVKQRLQSQLDHEPTLAEWAESVGMTCGTLLSYLHLGNRSREKIIRSNFCVVVHMAKSYQGKGLSLQDLLQEGSKGLMKSLEKFKPQTGCRFSTYAYWRIKQSIRKAIIQNSRTIRLPDNVYNLLRQISKAKELFVKEGHHQPTSEELAKRVGVTVEKLEKLLISTRVPLSMQQPAWTVQDITADTKVETPQISMVKNLMRQHVDSLLISILPPRERRIIQLRYGIEGGLEGKYYSLAQIGTMFGLSMERIRQLEKQALDKLKKCASSQGLEAYAHLLRSYS